jgi:uncharacterized protein (DUF305 family)
VTGRMIEWTRKEPVRPGPEYPSTMVWSRQTAVALALSAILAGCAGGPAPTVPTPQAAKGYPHTEADVRFMTAMIRHHSQAITMAEWAPARGASPAVLRLAERVVNGQRDEIATMERWLTDRDLPLPDSAGQHHHHANHGTAMPGMLTPEQLAQLSAARGPLFDRLFLSFMIQHHRGAVTMVKELVGTPGAAQEQTVFKFASDVNVDQATEIARMERMLKDLS